MREVVKLTDNKWMNLFRVRDDSKGIKAFEYAERKGTDSIAFIGYDADKERYCLTNECLPPTEGSIFLARAFGGSLDKDVTKKEIVIDEAKEEGGFTIDVLDVHCVGKSFVSSMMNQYCHLYLVNLTGKEQGERAPENAVEALARPVWMTRDEVVAGDDWKAIAIINKAERFRLKFQPTS
tara:strand:+ start:196 stop:735 length:540 start_codon:yes stop_codon:yes gene_type:complete